MRQFVQVRIKISLYKRISELAKQDNRSIANYINKVLDEATRELVK